MRPLVAWQVGGSRPDIVAVWGQAQKSFLDERAQDVAAYEIVKSPQPLDLSSRQAQAGNLEKLASNDLKPIPRRWRIVHRWLGAA